MRKKKELPVDKKAIKALVTLFGPREAARQANLPENTVLYWAAKFKWKKAAVAEGPPDAGDLITEALQRSKKLSTVAMAKFVERASLHAADDPNPLKIAAKVKDVAYVHDKLWPKEKASGIIEGAILIGRAAVMDEKPVTGREVTDADNEPLREDLPDSRSSGD